MFRRTEILSNPFNLDKNIQNLYKVTQDINVTIVFWCLLQTSLRVLCVDKMLFIGASNVTL